MWYANNQRLASDTDVILFRGLLKAPQYLIKTRLRQLFEDDEERDDAHSNHVRGRYTANPYTEERGAPSHVVKSDQQETCSFAHQLKPDGSSQQFVNTNTHTTAPCDVRTAGNTVQSQQNLANDIARLPLKGDSVSSISWLPAADVLVGQSYTAALNLSGDMPSKSAAEVLRTGIDNTDGSIFHRGVSAQQSFVNEPISDPGLLHVDHSIVLASALVPNRPRVNMTASLRAAIVRFIDTRRAKGCQAIRSHEKQAGIYECTLKCQRRFKTSNDLFRHESTIFPQDFWFCTRCGDLDSASERYLFTREDKMRQHNKIIHNDTRSIVDCKVPNAPKIFPERCSLCTHHRHRNWKDRCKHTIWHYKRGDALPKCLHTPDEDTTESGGPPGDDDDDDDDGNDSQDGNDDDPPTDDGGGFNTGNDELPPDNHDGNDGSDSPDPPNAPDDFSSLLNWDLDSLWRLQTTVYLSPISTSAAPNISQSSSQPVSIQWKERVNQKGGTASVFSVEVSLDDHDDSPDAKPRSRVVKQYPSQHHRLFEKELEAFAILSEQEPHPNIIRCFGSFELSDRAGGMTHNILLEDAQCDLFEYFADTVPPTTPAEIFGFWSQLFGIASALKRIHEPHETAVGWHADVKPDNILFIDSEFKLADFGFSQFARRPDREKTSNAIIGGTATYGMAQQGRLKRPITDELSCAGVELLRIHRYSCPCRPKDGHLVVWMRVIHGNYVRALRFPRNTVL